MFLISTRPKQSRGRTNGSSMSFCSSSRESTTRSRRWSAPTKRWPCPGVRFCWTVWKRRSPCWRRDTTTWRSSHALMITSTFYRWGAQIHSRCGDKMQDSPPISNLNLLILIRAGSLCPAPLGTKTWTTSVLLPITPSTPPREPLLHWRSN